AASFFPVIFLGIFWKRMNKEGAIAGMAVGLSVTAAYIVHFKIGFTSGVIGAVALIVAAVLMILHFGLKNESDTRAMFYGSLGLVAVFFAGVFGVLPSIPQGTEAQWLLGVSPEGFGAIGMAIAFVTAVAAALATKAPPREVQDMVEEIRIPSGRTHVAHAPAE
ncbi:MAG: sodium:solute symporter family transporter, partial [Oceanicaulis sp.]